MDITEDTYPVFAVNQVLTNAHLNDLFDYLDEQSRLTRANLIGIGIVCGLELEFNGSDTIRLTRGCGITSEGYLILEPEDVDLVAVRPYALPADLGYPPFVDATKEPPQLPLWELLDDEDEDGAVLLTDPLLGLDQKAVLLLLELRRDAQRTCLPNDCDDRGARVTATLRRLLVDVTVLDTIKQAAGASSVDLGVDLTERLQLPDLRMPRFDVPNTSPVETEEVLRAFQAVFRDHRLVAATAAALSALYAAFRPVVVDIFPNDPFSTFGNRFGFLDANVVTTAQVRFLPYYWDLFDDLVAAYDELRWAGVDLLCACCPPAELFPRHLMVGVLDPTAHDVADYRHHFVRSPAVRNCADRSRQVRQLFRRLVAMLTDFSETAPDGGIKATPSRWGDVPLSAKAIPFYYSQRGTPPLFELWDPVRTARRRANQNRSYRAGEYVPAAPDFVADPLRFDLEPDNFLRIEGHLGRDVLSVLKNLLSLRRSHRLPFEVVALRTGAFDESVAIDLAEHECRFADLETLYDTLRAELICFLVKQVEYLYAIPLPPDLPADGDPIVPTLSLLREHDPDFRAQPGTFGFVIESFLTAGRPVPLILTHLAGPNLLSQVFALVGAMNDLAARVPDALAAIDLPRFAEAYERLVAIARRTEELRRGGVFDEPGLSDRLDDIVFRCRLDPFAALVEEWRRQLRAAQQAQFLGPFLREHPGIQHKAGVPLGGTFVLVYHEPSRLPLPEEPIEPIVPILPLEPIVRPVLDLDRPLLGSGRRTLLEQALDRLADNPTLADDPDLGLVFREVTGKRLPPPKRRQRPRVDVYTETVAELDSGTVVADFFLPYVCGSGCATVQFQLPPARLRVRTSTACTNADGFAAVTVEAAGATGPLSVRVDEQPFEELTGSLRLSVGEHTILARDGEGAESGLERVRIPPPLRIAEPVTQVDEAAGTWQVLFTVDGGTPPYVADVGIIVDRTFTSPVLPVAEMLSVQVIDAAGCTVAGRFESGVKPCDLPCGGDAIRSGYRFWLPEPPKGSPFKTVVVGVTRFVVADPDGNTTDLTAKVARILPDITNPLPSLNSTDFVKTAPRWLRDISSLVAEAFGSNPQRWLTLEYESPTDQGTTGSLFIDRLVCVDIAFELEVTFVQGDRTRHLQISYGASGTVVTDLNTDRRVQIPAFGVTTVNKCRSTDPVPLCTGTDLKLEIGRDGVIPDDVVLKARVSGGDSPDALLWEVQDGIPSLANDEAVTVRFDPTEPAEKLVRLTAFTKSGCVVTKERTVDITKPEV
jgi:hypothetical protein